MNNKRMPKTITDKDDIEFLLNLVEDDVTTTFIMDCFGEFNGKRKFNAYDEFDVPKNYYGSDTLRNDPFRTTVGLWIYNKYFIEKDLFNLFQYVGESMDKKLFNKINTKLSYALMEDDITLPQLKKYLMKTQKFMPYVSILSPSHTLKMLVCTREIEAKKAELLKLHKKELDAGNEMVFSDIEKELLAYAKELLKDDPSMDSYNSGAIGSFDNNFKNMYVMRGLAKDPDPDKGYNMITSNYMTGIKKEDYANIANSLSAGPYARAKNTETGGYWEKLFLSAYQHLTLDDPGSDCGTKRYIDLDFSKNTIEDYIYSYIVEGNNLVEITSKNLEKYRNSKVKLRFSSLCESKTGFCNMCAGNMFYRIGNKNVGMITPQIPSRLKVISMKSFHDSAVRFEEMNPMKAFSME